MKQFQTPDRKVTYGAFVSACLFLVVWAISAIFGVVVPAEPAIAAQTILVGIVQYYTKNSPTDML
jgi:hypothetical protein